jgi:hypothetical protein
MELKETEFDSWYLEEAYSDSLTACARVRLGKHNKKPYEAILEQSREGVGTAYYYPTPSQMIYKSKRISSLLFQYAVIDYQTHFMTDSIGRTRKPFIRKYYYDESELLYTDTLNPVTYKKLRN